MLKLSPLSSLLVVSGIAAAAGFACSSGGVEEGPKVHTPTTGGTESSSAGTGNSPGTSGTGSTAGTSTTGGTGSGGSGQAGSQASAGSNGMAGSGTGGTGGGTGGTGGAGGTGGSSNNSFCGTEEGKVMLFDGSDATFKNWYPNQNDGMNKPNPWTNNGDGTMTVKGADIISKTAFQNVCLHVEYQAPKYTYTQTTPEQERGNSGVYLKASWEMQVLDTFDLGKTQNDFCGAVYKVAAPLVSACKTGGEWNAYDIEFQANVCGATPSPAKFIKVNLNGVNIHNNVVLPAQETEAGLDPVCEARGVLLQNHSSIVPVSFRNIWAIPRP